METRLFQMILLQCFSIGIIYSQPTSIKVDSGSTENESAMPGQRFELQVTVLYKQQVKPVIVNATVVNGDAQVASGPWLISTGHGAVEVSLAVHCTPEQNVSIFFWIVDNESVHDQINVTVIQCVPGYMFDETLEQCVCDKELAIIGIYCDLSSGAINVPYPLWLGPVTDNFTQLGWTYCLKNYCEPSWVRIVTTDCMCMHDFSNQCAEESHRSGVGCGSCEPNYSAILGSSQCRECTSISLILVLLFLVTGPLTVTGIAVLRITITEGYLNAILFYSNVANLFAQYFSPGATGKGAFFLAAWISQSFGLPACFYNGMTTLAVTSLHLLYILYLFALTGFFTLILHWKSLTFSKEHAPSKVIGTMLVLCYTSLLETCMGILSFSNITTLKNETLIRWYYDADVVYFSGFHAFLCVVAILIFLLYLIPFPFLIISPRITYKVRVFNKLQPLLDTFWAPFKPKYRWWISFRFFLRWIIVFVATFVPTSYNILSVSTLLVVLLFIQTQVRPFRGYWQNILDEALVTNITLILSGYCYFTNSSKHIISPNRFNEEGAQIYGACLVVIAYLLFMAVFAHHLSLRFPKCKLFICSLPLKLKDLLRGSKMYSMEELNIQETDEAPLAVTHFEIDIPKDEREEDKLSLTRELHELVSLPESAAVETKAKPQTPTKSRPKISLKENKDTLEGFPLLKTRAFTEDREPLLAEDNV